MTIIKQDFKAFIRPMLMYLISTQVLWAVAFNIDKYFGDRTEILINYFVVFTYVIVVVSTIAFTILWAVYYNTKSNLIHRQQYQLTDGYGLYRFIGTVKFLLIIVVNFVFSLVFNDIIEFSDLLQIEYTVYFGSLFFLIPLFSLVIFSIAKMRNKVIFRNLVAMLSFVAIIVGLYIAGNLYYFNNPQQGVATLILLFIPIAILYTAFKDRNSIHKIYKLTIFIMCLFVTFSSVVLFATSDFNYDYNNGQQLYEPEYSKVDVNVKAEIITTEFGDLVYVTNEKEMGDTYALTTDKYTYRINQYEDGYQSLNAYQLNNANQVTINMYSGLTEPEVVNHIYDPEKNRHTTCTMALSDVGTDQDCAVDPEVIDVYNGIQAIINDRS